MHDLFMHTTRASLLHPLLVSFFTLLPKRMKNESDFVLQTSRLQNEYAKIPFISDTGVNGAAYPIFGVGLTLGSIMAWVRRRHRTSCERSFGIFIFILFPIFFVFLLNQVVRRCQRNS